MDGDDTTNVRSVSFKNSIGEGTVGEAVGEAVGEKVGVAVGASDDISVGTAVG